MQSPYEGTFNLQGLIKNSFQLSLINHVRPYSDLFARELLHDKRDITITSLKLCTAVSLEMTRRDLTQPALQQVHILADISHLVHMLP